MSIFKKEIKPVTVMPKYKLGQIVRYQAYSNINFGEIVCIDTSVYWNAADHGRVVHSYRIQNNDANWYTEDKITEVIK